MSVTPSLTRWTIAALGCITAILSIAVGTALTEFAKRLEPPPLEATNSVTEGPADTGTRSAASRSFAQRETRVSAYSYDARTASTTPSADARFDATTTGQQRTASAPGSSTPSSSSVLAARGVTHAIPEGRLGHIFRDAPGHLADTPANRKLLQGVADDPATTLSADKFGNTWSARTLDDGTQAWTQTPTETSSTEA